MGFFSLCWNINSTGVYCGSRRVLYEKQALIKNIAGGMKWHAQTEAASWKDKRLYLPQVEPWTNTKSSTSDANSSR